MNTRLSLCMAISTLVFFVDCQCFANGAVTLIESAEKIYHIGPSMEILEDPGRDLTIHDVSSTAFHQQWKINGRGTVNLGTTRSAIWLRFQLVRRENVESEGWLLNLGFPILLKVTLFWQELQEELLSWKNIHVGERGLLSREDADLRQLLFALPQLQEREQLFYVRIETPTVVFLSPTVAIRSVNSYAMDGVQVLQGMCIAILITMAMYNLMIYSFSIVARYYLFYVLYVLLTSIYFIHINGLAYSLGLPVSQHLMMKIGITSMGLALLSAINFARYFLDTKKYVPWIDRFLLIYSLVFLVVIMFYLVTGDYYIMNTFTIYAGTPVPFMLLATTILCQLKGVRSAWLFFAAWGLMLISGVIYSNTLNGILPFSTVTFFSYQIGSVLETILLSLALAYRIRSLQEERDNLLFSNSLLQNVANQDALTGLFNRRFFDNHLAIEIKRCQSAAKPISVIMLDVDNFKCFNDTYGHQTGDDVLRMLGCILRSVLRDREFPCRYGGEEFIVIVPEVDQQLGVKIAERIRSTVAMTTVAGENGIMLSVTVSIGVATVWDETDLQEIVSRADQALYQSKRSGKNRVTHYMEDAQCGSI